MQHDWGRVHAKTEPAFCLSIIFFVVYKIVATADAVQPFSDTYLIFIVYQGQCVCLCMDIHAYTHTRTLCNFRWELQLNLSCEIYQYRRKTVK